MKAPTDTWSVLEVSSFQLESTEKFHPKIAVILNITPDHLDRHGTFENYALAKERIFAAQDASDFVVLNADNAAHRRGRGSFACAGLLVFGKASGRAGRVGGDGNVVYRPAPGAALETMMPLEKIPLKGEHNVENVLAAVCAARLAGVAAEKRLPGPLRISRPWSIAWNMWTRSMAWITTTTPRPPMWTRRKRPWPHFPAAFT